jgi:hypothetical protein
LATEHRLAHHGRLSRRNLEFREYAVATPEAQVRANFSTVAERAGRFTVPVQPWPTFVRRDRLTAWEQQAIALERLIKDIPRRLFDNDPARIASVFCLPSEQLATVIMAEPNGIPEALSRLDFIEVDGELKLLELNSGSYLGGCELSTLAGSLPAEPMLAPFFGGVEAPVRSTQPALLRHMLRNLRDSPLAEGADRFDIGYVFTRGGLEDLLCNVTHVFYNQTARSVAEELGIDFPCALHCLDESEIEVRGDRVYANGIRLHAIFEQYENLTSKELFRSMKSGRLHLYTGPATAVVGSKRNVALLYELRDTEVFSDEERALIERSVPWTHAIQPTEVEWDGSTAYLPELLQAERQRLVLKPALASAGVNVFLGRSTPEEKWREMVRTALEGPGRWIVQELMASPPDLYQIGDEGCRACEVVWGLYSFGGEPGGGYLRLDAVGGGPLNVGQGADVGFYFAVDDEGDG